MGASEQLVILRGGLAVPVTPYLLLHRLEATGFALKVSDDDEDLLIAPFEQLAPADLEALKRWKHHVMLLLSYVADDSHLVGPGDLTDAARRDRHA